MITVNGNRSEWKEGLTVEKLLARENYTFRMISVWINDQPVEDVADLSALLKDAEPGAALRLSVFRKASNQTLEILVYLQELIR